MRNNLKPAFKVYIKFANDERKKPIIVYIDESKFTTQYIKIKKSIYSSKGYTIINL